MSLDFFLYIVTRQTELSSVLTAVVVLQHI